MALRTMLIQALVLLAGLLLGALLNILIVRLPRAKGLWGWPRCTRTGERLALWQLVPLFGWLLQGGRARNGQPIAWIYPLVELLSALLLLRLYQLYALSADFFYLAFVCAILLLTGAIDWLHRYIYTFLVLGASLIALMVGPVLGMDWRNLLLGALFGGSIFLLFFIMARLLFPTVASPFGLGDVYLAIFIGSVVGLVNLGPALVYGMILAGIVAAGIMVARAAGRPTPTYIAYGSYLCLGVLIFIALGRMG